MNEHQLLGKWLCQLLKNHFIEQKKDHTEKLFIKINGLTKENFINVLTQLEKDFTELKAYYEPIIRTMTPIKGLEIFSYKEHETSTWLRNNTKTNQALILLINETTPEGQSLENLFTIDEAYLMSKPGLDAMYEVLSQNGVVASEEIKTLKTFLELYNKISEPQLRNVLSFLVNVVTDPSPSIIEKIQKYLPYVNLFSDAKLQINTTNINRMKKNFSLANLRDGARSLDQEKLQNNLYSFLEEEEKINWDGEEIWTKVDPEKFREEAIDFINQKNKEFLKYDIELAEKIFKFTIKQPTLINQLENVLENNQTDVNNDQVEKFKEGIEEIENGTDVELIQDFVDEFEEILDTQPGLVKKLNRLIEKRRNPSEYEDLTFALLHEAFSMIEEERENENIREVQFKLEVNNTKLPENIIKLLYVYLNNLSSVIPLISFESNSIPKEADDTSKDNDIVFNLSMILNENEINKRKFKVYSFKQLYLYSLIQQLENDESIPHINVYAENEIETLDIKHILNDNVKYYISSNDLDIKNNVQTINHYLEEYMKILQCMCKDGIFTLKVNELENDLNEVLSNIYTSVPVSKHIYQIINLIGTIDTYENQKNETGIPYERIVTLFNPIRLISYIKRFYYIQDQLFDWICKAAEGNLEVEKLEEYLEFVVEKTSSLSPRYFSSNGDDSFLIETKEIGGEGRFILNTHPSENADYLAKEFSDELVKVVKNYFEVYPYAKDGLEVLFLYCQSAELVTKSIDELFKKTKVKKLNLTVHSENAARLHDRLNKWIEQREEFNKPEMGKRFPKVEINVISGKNINEIASQAEKKMSDSDIVALVDYFGQGNQIKYNFERTKVNESSNWFEPTFKEPLKADEAVKRISYVSENMPEVLQNFYQLQYIIQSNVMPDKEEINVLRNLISISNVAHSSLIDYMHNNFNWSMIMDRYIDKTLLQKTSSKAEIVQYKSKAGSNKNFKVITSSSKYIRKLTEQTRDHAYYDRLYKKLGLILKNQNINRDKVVNAVQIVKDISGGLVLKVIGRGKYAHEMMATYFTLENRSDTEEKSLQNWAVCDELTWFASNKRRPDMVRTTINKVNDRISINFELVELKFINHRIFDQERFDAIKQIKSGVNLYTKLFNFNKNKLDSDFWRNELVHYLIERQAYSPDCAKLIKELQHVSIENLDVNITGAIDVYCYTSNLTEYQFDKVSDGVFLDYLEEGYKNNIYTRSYILSKLGATEQSMPSYEELEETEDKDNIFGSNELFFEEGIKNDDSNDADVIDVTNENDIEDETEKDAEEVDEETNDEENEDINKDNDDVDVDNKGDKLVSNDFPEKKALINLELEYDTNDSSIEELKDKYSRKLINNFNQNGVFIKIKDSIVGSSVIRLILTIPADLPQSKVTSRSKDVQLWLGLNNEPHIFINSQGINIDIVRENPETIYFENFMELVRKQHQSKINGTNLIAPLGLDPLNNVITMDFSNSVTPHLLTGGTTGSGKSVTLNSIILGMMCLYSPEQVRFVFIDPKKVEFTIYENRIHTQSVITDINEAVTVLKGLVDEMEERYTLFQKELVTNLEEYVTEVGEKMHRIVVVFDEFADFMSQEGDVKKEVENAILRLGQKARAAGIHLIICTQNPRADIINTNIRNNLGARLALRATDVHASNVILGQDGAEKLAGKGDFLAKVYGETIRGKSPYLTPKVRRALLKYFEG
ncbi:FtsK/SpoIIIE domain-containing protein [Gottfriedia acidiceleris]|uniref:FtsK/SpoIIIE domain-containing protein n=1 Tax=Gottfriedia acidiceleris TaxID=371036 RepID=UPI00101DF3EC|nr:FtsK/SpoIIIE domain-containing protein [Gottfriedia acidiceleris]